MPKGILVGEATNPPDLLSKGGNPTCIIKIVIHSNAIYPIHQKSKPDFNHILG